MNKTYIISQKIVKEHTAIATKVTTDIKRGETLVQREDRKDATEFISKVEF